MLNHCISHVADVIVTVADGIANYDCVMFTLMADVIAMYFIGRCWTTNWCIILADVIAKWQTE